MKSPRRTLVGLLMLLAVCASLFSLNGNALEVARGRPAAYPGDEPFISGLSDSAAPLFRESDRGPIVSQVAAPYVWNGDLRDLPQNGSALPHLEAPRPGTNGESPLPTLDADPVAQTWQGPGQMPAPMMNFPGLSRSDGGGWSPPDTNGDVGPVYYIQTVNIALGIYTKTSGLPAVVVTFNDFFQGPPGSACDTNNRGDVVVLYDPIADRWIVTDFAFPTGESRECIAVSQTGDPVSGGWYFYDVDTENAYGSWCDYPKLGVWPDAYYMSCNMFEPSYGGKVFALNRDQMLAGDPVDVVSFDLGSAYWSLLPANMRGALPPAGAPNYFTSVSQPNTMHLWEFHVDWANPGDSTFTGPIDLTVANFVGAPWTWIPQGGTGQLLDSLGDRLMFSLHYRNMGDYESLWATHTVQSNGVAGVRWYEVRDPGGTPVVYQQGTFQPDQDYRWMGSVATDQDGNMALGYSVSSASMYPEIRYTGRLNGEILGLLPQGETLLHAGSGSQSSTNRWGDYSLMSVDPVDDCTFWYTQEYMNVTGGNWNTRIGSFRFPSCGEPKGWIAGMVYNPATGQGIAGAPVVASGAAMVMSIETDATGHFRFPLLAGSYDLTAGPMPPSYPTATVVPAVPVTTGNTTTVNIPLLGIPYLEGAVVAVDDNVAGGNGNGYPEPGETELLLWATITNTGASTSTNVTAHLTSLTAGVTVTVSDAAYPDFAVGAAWANTTPFAFSIDPSVPCGAQLEFQQVVTADEGTYTITFGLDALVPLPIVHLFTDDMESGPGNWTHGGYPDLWTITEEQAHSPSHAWSDSPGANYGDNISTWLRTPTFDLTGAINTQFSFWHRYWLETGWDYGQVQYSLNGSYWQDLVSYTGRDETWSEEVLDTPALDNQPNVMLRFLITSDSNTNFDGWYIDDVGLSYQPFGCYYLAPAVPILVSPPDGTVSRDPGVTFTWEPGTGGGTLEGYNLELDGSAVYTTTAPTLALTLTAGLHTWRVRAYHSAATSDYTAAWTIEVQEPPDVPELLAPADGTVLTTTNDVTLTWQAGGGYAPDWYDLDLDGVTQTVTMTAYPTTLPGGDHTWRVRACNTAGCSDYTTAWAFTIIEAPAAPVLLTPPDGTVTTTQIVSLTWQPSTTGGLPDWYNVDVSGTVFTETTAGISMTLGYGDYSWSVRGCNAAGCSAYAPTWTLTILEAAGVPELLAPEDGTVTTTTTLTFTWQAGAGGTPEGYNLELDGMVITTTVPMYTTTLATGEHTWRVRAYDAVGYTAYSESWTVTVREDYRVFLPLVSR